MYIVSLTMHTNCIFLMGNMLLEKPLIFITSNGVQSRETNKRLNIKEVSEVNEERPGEVHMMH